MKIKIFIVTYDGESHLRDNLNSLFSSDNFDNLNVEVNVINNHSNFLIDDVYKSKVHVFENELRPDFSTGHLARNWNQAIINGFKNLESPDCDLLIHCQDDILWKSDWYISLLDNMKTYTFFTSGNGDAFCCYKPEAVRNIGLWDERFCNIGYHEYDYFIRAVIYNGEQSSINDEGDQFRNPWNTAPRVTDSVLRDGKKHDNHMKSVEFHPVSGKVFAHKWGFEGNKRDSSENFWIWVKQNITKTQSINFVFYPYFEKHIFDLSGKNYLI